MCVNGINDRTFIQLDRLHRCNDLKCSLYLQKHLFQESNGNIPQKAPMPLIGFCMVTSAFIAYMLHDQELHLDHPI